MNTEKFLYNIFDDGDAENVDQLSTDFEDVYEIHIEENLLIICQILVIVCLLIILRNIRRKLVLGWLGVLTEVPFLLVDPL